MEDVLFEKFRCQLEKRRDELLSLIEMESESTKPVELDQTRVGRVSRVDALQGQAMSIEVGRRRHVELQNIRVALGRIEDGEFGYCLECGNQIAIKRLELDPSVKFCIDCASRQE